MEVYVRVFLGGVQLETEWEGEPVTIPGYEEYKFFATPAVENYMKGSVRITEARTGYSVGRGGDNVEDAVAEARKGLEILGKEKINQRIEETIRVWGELPYRG